MATDKEMLDFLESLGESSGLKWLVRTSSTGRGWRLHQDPKGEYKTARLALEGAMKKYGAPVTKLKVPMLDRMVTWLFGRKCEKCGSRNTQHASYWARGWDNSSKRLYSDWGAYCSKCHHITWDRK